MEELVIEDAREIEAFVEDDDSVKKKRRRRVSFAERQTIHLIPRTDDIETPPLSAALSNTPNPPTPLQTSADFSQFTCDMDTGHGSWVDEDTTVRQNSFDEMEDDSGCYVNLGHISRIEEDDSIVNDVLHDDITMDATTFTRNLSQFIKLSTTFDSQGAGLLVEVLPKKNLGDNDSQNEDDSMALTKSGAPHWALINRRDESMHVDDDRSDMSLATETNRALWNERKSASTDTSSDILPSKSGEPRSPGKPCTNRSPQKSSPGKPCTNRSSQKSSPGKQYTNRPVQQSSPGKPYTNRSPQPLKENMSLDKLQDRPTFRAQKWSLDPHCDSDVSMSLSSTTDISLHQYLAKRSDVLVDLDGNTQTPPMSRRRRSHSLMQDTTFSASELNATVPVRDLKDLLLDHTDYSITMKNFIQAELSIGEMLDSQKGKFLIKEDQAGEEGMLPLKLQTLSDYLFFSCSWQPQMDWLIDHVHKLEARLNFAQNRNTELRSSKFLVQKHPEDSTHIFKSRLSTKYSLAKKEWLLWKMNPERQNLAMLQERKDNLLKEVEAVHGNGQQVVQLKDLYSGIISTQFREVSTNKGPANLSSTSKEAQLLANHEEKKEMEKGGLLPTALLEKCHHHYQDVCERLRISKAKWNAIQAEIKSKVSILTQKLQSSTAEASLIENLELSIRKLSFTNSLLQQQQVMDMSAKNDGGKPEILFSLQRMYSQSFQFEGDSPPAQVKLSRTLHLDAIEMTFPCMEAALFFQYLSRDLHSNTLVQMQHVHQIMQRTNRLFGCMMDLLKEIKYCRRNFGASCKFKMQNDKLSLCVTLLRCSHGLRVAMMFDMGCVKGGRYPSDLKPVEVQIRMYGCSSTGLITRKEVMARIAKLETGFRRLDRICNCVEKLMKTAPETA